MIEENFVKIYEESFRENWELPALSGYNENSLYTYGDVAREIRKLHILFEQCHIREGDKIALIGKNSCQWCIIYLASITYGAVIVPILQEFNSNDVQHIINHSDSVFLFCSDNIWNSLEQDQMKNLRGVFSIVDLRLLYQSNGESFDLVLDNLENLFASAYPDQFTKEHIRFADVPNEKVVVFNYTSGTTGFSKGVMITGNNLAGNIVFVRKKISIDRGYKMLSFLPLAHAYGCTFEFLYPLSAGCHLILLGKTPSPKILLQAFEEIRPILIFAVPLILEKIYKKTILPAISKRLMRWSLKIPLLNSLIYFGIRKKLINAFGGNFIQVVVGGAPLNIDVESFFHKIKFPVSVGYGMTECAPLISFSLFEEYKPYSCGKVLDTMEVRIDSDDPYSIAGEIQVRGENVMAGYYKCEDAAQNVFTDDGWLRTGDLGTIDKDYNIFIRGRSKSMILSANGQNIYPEEIEAKLNNLPFVMESLIIEENKKLIALVYPDHEALDSECFSEGDLPQLMEDNKTFLNNLVAGYEKISEIRLHPVEFEKTPKKSIRRCLYNDICS